MVKLTPKQEQFTLNIFSGMSQREAYIKAGYSSNMLPNTIDRNASALANSNKILTRLNALKKKAESDKVMSVKERKERLSEIGRGRLTDYQESGQDGGWINIGPESPNTAAISEIVSTTTYDKNGANPTLISRIKLHNPVNAIQELNKMERIYNDGATVNIDNRTLNIEVDDDPKRTLIGLLDRIAARAREGEMDKQSDAGAESQAQG